MLTLRMVLGMAIVMKRFTFATFQVNDGNRDAYEICQKISQLLPVQPQPITLLGESGCGKTHLLYAIVNRVRAGITKAGIAYVTAYDFPDPVRALVDDPSPIRKSRKAILLVDQLEEFGDLADDLEAVVQGFLEANHAVLFGTSIHPKRLTNISPRLVDVITHGLIVPMRSTTIENVSSSRQQRHLQEEHQAELSRYIAEVRDLRNTLENTRREIAEHQQRESETLQLRVNTLAEMIDSARQETSTQWLLIHRLVEDLRVALETSPLVNSTNEDLNERLHQLENEISRLSVEREAIAAERDGLRVRLESLRKSRDELQTERDTLERRLKEMEQIPPSADAHSAESPESPYAG